MSELTKEANESFLEKLNEIGLDLNNIPNFLKDYKELDFRPSKRFDNKEYLVYRYIPINDIQILITPTNRLTDIKEKYALAKPISQYLQPQTEEGALNFATFLNLLRNTEIEEIQEVEKKQKELNKAIPFRVKYEKNYLWQIYYSEWSDKYFMLVPSEDIEYGSFFYLLREQIKQKNEYIYVPIANFEPNNNILKKSERADLENYLWLFTKKWPNIYEVTEKNGETKLIIVGEVEVYNSINATYRVEILNRDIATRFYKQLKAMFILQTELPDFYYFRPQIDENGKLELYYENDLIDYQELSKFIKNEYLKMKKNIEEGNKLLNILQLKLESLKQESNQKEKEFFEKQKEISTYLQYRRTFFGRVKYFFSKKKTKNIEKLTVKEQSQDIQQNKENEDEEKKFYTIEDLITICNSYTKVNVKIKNNQLDIEAIELKNYNLSKKIENATLYINEINSHKKSIFEFWKFSSKDDMLSLNSGDEEQEKGEEKKLHKVFDYENDREEIAKQIDKAQREKLSKEEKDSVFISSTQILPTLNKIKTLVKITDTKVEELLEELKEEAKQSEKLYNNGEYDIFGAISEDNMKIRNLGGNRHREKEKNKFQILGINEDTTLAEFKETLKKLEAILSKSFSKVQNVIDMPIYKLTDRDEKIDLYGYSIYSINAESELMNSNIDSEECNLFKLNLQEGMPAIFFSNIMFFDNYNKTLPLGMDKSNELILNSDNFSFVLKSKKTINTNQYFLKQLDAPKWNTKKIHIYEYDIELKRPFTIGNNCSRIGQLIRH